ncbi:MAG: hypothetical protein QF805_23455, partial [Pirellulaceae bacterium]|nr:hypothetical protein [Pirellulaceae bacterium]
MKSEIRKSEVAMKMGIARLPQIELSSRHQLMLDRAVDRWSDAQRRELLRGRALQMNVVTFSCPERGDHVIGGPGVDRLQRGGVDPAFVTGIAEHVQRLTTMIDNHPPSGEIADLEPGFRF